MYVPIPDGHGGYTRYRIQNQQDWFWYLSQYANSDDQFIQRFLVEANKNQTLEDWTRQWQGMQDAYANVKSGSNPNDELARAGQQGIGFSDEFNSFLTNAGSQFNTQQAQDYNTWSMQNNLLSQGSQLQQLGLSTSGVLQTGGSTGVGVTPADSANVSSNRASLRQQAKINRYNAQLGMARNLISTAGSMASSGIYGAAIGAVKHSASQLAGAAAHSGLQALKATNNPNWQADWDSFVKDSVKANKKWLNNSPI